MIKITAKARLLGALFLLLSAALLGGCVGTNVSSGQMNDFIPGQTTEAQIVAELGEATATDETAGDMKSASARWSYLIKPESLRELESYLDSGEKLDQVVDVSRYLHKQYIYTGLAYTPIPLYTVTIFVFDQNGVLVQKNQVKWLANSPYDCDTEYEECESYDPYEYDDFQASVEAVLQNYLTIYEADDVARLKEELIRIKGPKDRPGADKKQPDAAKSPSAGK